MTFTGTQGQREQSSSFLLGEDRDRTGILTSLALTTASPASQASVQLSQLPTAGATTRGHNIWLYRGLGPKGKGIAGKT